MLSSSIKLFSFCALAFWQISITSALDCPPDKKYYKNKACAATCADLSDNYSINVINCNPDHLDEFCGCEDGLIFDDEGQCSSPQLAACLVPEPLPEPVMSGFEGEIETTALLGFRWVLALEVSKERYQKSTRLGFLRYLCRTRLRAIELTLNGQIIILKQIILH